jgi:hypothetical protein
VLLQRAARLYLESLTPGKSCSPAAAAPADAEAVSSAARAAADMAADEGAAALASGGTAAARAQAPKSAASAGTKAGRKGELDSSSSPKANLERTAVDLLSVDSAEPAADSGDHLGGAGLTLLPPPLIYPYDWRVEGGPAAKLCRYFQVRGRRVWLCGRVLFPPQRRPLNWAASTRAGCLSPQRPTCCAVQRAQARRLTACPLRRASQGRNPNFNATKCKDLALAMGAYTVTYWGHSWSRH